MDLNDFNYNLPKELIAQQAVRPKDHSRLLVVHNDKLEHKRFYDVIDYLQKGDVLVINETKVARARIYGKKLTGSKAELIICKKLNDNTFECRIKGNRIRIGNVYEFTKDLHGEIIQQNNDVFTIEFNQSITQHILDDLFELPTPPYIKKRLENDKDYQTAYSTKEGSLAAPTAGLHFTDELIEKIKKKGVTIAKVCLHVGFGTFLPIKEDILSHKMHEEYFEIDKENADLINNRKDRLIVVGTTSVRTLESATDENGKVKAMSGSTDIFIYPGYKFKNKIDAIITNFHLPKSTLLLLVSAYYGKEKILHAYHEAVKEKYRFYSLGDAMILIK